MADNQNATFLTQLYKGKEVELWTQIIAQFLRRFSPELPLYASISEPGRDGTCYVPQPNTLKTEGDIFDHVGYDNLLGKIGEAFDKTLFDYPGRITDTGDIAGIEPDLLIIHPAKHGVVLFENKPYYHSVFTGNQYDSNLEKCAYVRFVRWLNSMGIPTKYVVIHSSSWNKAGAIKQLNDVLGDNFGSVMLEDIFLSMHTHHFEAQAITESWYFYTNKSPEC